MAKDIIWFLNLQRMAEGVSLYDNRINGNSEDFDCFGDDLYLLLNMEKLRRSGFDKNRVVLRKDHWFHHNKTIPGTDLKIIPEDGAIKIKETDRVKKKVEKSLFPEEGPETLAPSITVEGLGELKQLIIVVYHPLYQTNNCLIHISNQDLKHQVVILYDKWKRTIEHYRPPAHKGDSKYSYLMGSGTTIEIFQVPKTGSYIIEYKDGSEDKGKALNNLTAVKYCIRGADNRYKYKHIITKDDEEKGLQEAIEKLLKESMRLPQLL